MNQLLNDFLLALAQTTRFDYRALSPETAAPASPHRWPQVVVRALMGAVYLLIAALLARLISQPVAATLLAAAAIYALHYWLTAGREARMPLLFLRNWATEPALDGPDTLGIFLQCLPALLLLALLFLDCALWLPAILAIGTAAGRDLARPASQHALAFDWAAWLAAFVVLFLTLICPYLGNELLRGVATRYALVVFLIAFLLTPWLRQLPRRPTGFTANSFLAGVVVTLMVLLIRCL